jgi:hypothetical protein
MGIADAKQAAQQGAPADPSPPAAGSAPVPNFYCLSKDHASRLVTMERFFYFGGETYPLGHPAAGEVMLFDQGAGRDPVPDMSKAPVCPVCTSKGEVLDPLTGRPRVTRVSAIPLEYDENGTPQIPAAIISIAQRAGEA